MAITLANSPELACSRTKFLYIQGMRTFHRRALAGFASLSCLSVLALLVSAGPLNPPAGAVAPTGKTTQEVFDRVAAVESRIAINATNTPGDADSVYSITQPGSYYLTGNITGVSGKHGIEIATTGVTLDLNGFELVGVAGSLDGVVNTLATNGTCIIRNGTVRGWGGHGIRSSDSGAVSGNISDIVASGNTVVGIRLGGGGVISRCTAANNVGDGFSVGASGVITECSSYVNGGAGIVTASGCTVSRNSARSNFTDGINVFNNCLVIENACTNNGALGGTGAGIRTQGNDNRIEGNNCAIADRGIHIQGTGNLIIRNSCSGNTTANWDIAANNVCGPVIDRTAPASAAILGNAAPSSLGSTDPNANFSY